jgi:DNA-binding transcriptional MerR regulator
MRYPFTPELLDALPEEMAELYRSLEATLLDEICSRLKLAGELNEVTVQDIRALRSHGISLEEIEKAIQRTANISRRELDKMLDEVMERNQRYYTDLIDLAGVTKPETMVSVEDTWAIYEQTRQELRNLTRSMGFLVDNGRTMLPPARAYQWALDNAEMQITSGAISYNQAIKSAVKQLADSGIKIVDYESGHRDQIDVAARRAVMTGVSQLCAKYTEQSAEYLETPYFEVSAHIGARDKGVGWQNHKLWQGRVYSVRAGDKYPNIYEVCGLGYVDGLEGANCRHIRTAFVDGVMERTYTDEELAHIDDGHDVDFEGKHYTAYEATQKQRQIERTVRKLKREQTAYKAAGLEEDAQSVTARIRRLNAEYKSFSEAAGLPLQRERMRVLYKSSTPPLALVPKVFPTTSQNYADVTAQWKETATPGSHTVQDLHEYTVKGVTYKVDGHNVVLDYSPHEKEIAELLEREFGGGIYMVPRGNDPQGVSTPDYLFRGSRFDLKSLKSGGKNVFYNVVAKKSAQADNFIFDLTDCPLNDKEITRQTELLFSSTHTKFIDTIVLLRNGEIIKILKRNK